MFHGEAVIDEFGEGIDADAEMAIPVQSSRKKSS
jgi:hypothetical protein